MAPFDLPPDQLAHYAPEVPEPADFDAFWHGTLKEARASAPILDVRPVPNGLRLVESWDVTFAGFGADPIRAWYTRPAGVRKWTKRMLIDGIRWRNPGGRALARHPGTLRALANGVLALCAARCARAMFSSSPNVVRIRTRTCQEAVVRANRSTASTVVSPRIMPI